ncbi:MAG TPA: hypothetical protein VGE93_02760, partial [Bryobacteraceae bacterium]
KDSNTPPASRRPRIAVNDDTSSGPMPSEDQSAPGPDGAPAAQKPLPAKDPQPTAPVHKGGWPRVTDDSQRFQPSP